MNNMTFKLLIPALLLMFLSCGQGSSSGKGGYQIENIKDVTAGYFEAIEKLYEDDFSGAQAGMAAFNEALKGVTDEKSSAQVKRIMQHLTVINAAKDMAGIRDHLHPLSYEVAQLINGNSIKLYGVNSFVCTMVKEGTGTGEGGKTGYWLSFDNTVNNPYHGAGMPHCGAMVNKVKK